MADDSHPGRGRLRPKFTNWDPKRNVRSQNIRLSRSCEGCKACRMVDHHLGRVDGDMDLPEAPSRISRLPEAKRLPSYIPYEDFVR